MNVKSKNIPILEEKQSGRGTAWLTLIVYRRGFFSFRPAKTFVSTTKWLQLIAGSSFAVILVKFF